MANPQLDELLETLLPFAQDMLRKEGEFFPFGASIGQDDKVILNSTYDGNEHPESKDVIALLSEAFKQEAKDKQIKAVGICFDVFVTLPNTNNKVDAIQCSLEHLNGESISVYVPYSKSFFGGIKYGEIFVQTKERQIF